MTRPHKPGVALVFRVWGNPLDPAGSCPVLVVSPVVVEVLVVRDVAVVDLPDPADSFLAQGDSLDLAESLDLAAPLVDRVVRLNPHLQMKNLWLSPSLTRGFIAA